MSTRYLDRGETPVHLSRDEILEVVARRIAVAFTDAWDGPDEDDVLAIYNDLEHVLELLECLPPEPPAEEPRDE